MGQEYQHLDSSANTIMLEARMSRLLIPSHLHSMPHHLWEEAVPDLLECLLRNQDRFRKNCACLGTKVIGVSCDFFQSVNLSVNQRRSAARTLEGFRTSPLLQFLVQLCPCFISNFKKAFVGSQCLFL